MVDSNGNEHLARIDQKLEAIATAMADGFEALKGMNRVLDSRLRALDSRLSLLESQMDEVMRQLRVVASFAHSHEAA